MEGCACANFGNSSGTEGETRQLYEEKEIAKNICQIAFRFRDIRGRQIRLVQFSNDFVKKTTGSSRQIRLVRCTYTIVTLYLKKDHWYMRL